MKKQGYFQSIEPHIQYNNALWPHQIEAFEKLRYKAFSNTHGSNNSNKNNSSNSDSDNNARHDVSSAAFLLHMCTGSGKHLLALTSPFAIPHCRRALILFHNKILRDQVDVKRYLLEMEIISRHQDLPKVNVVKSSKDLQDFAAKYKSSDIVIASAHSFGNRPAIWTHIPRDYFSVVVVDEGHHARAYIFFT